MGQHLAQVRKSIAHPRAKAEQRKRGRRTDKLCIAEQKLGEQAETEWDETKPIFVPMYISGVTARPIDDPPDAA